MYIIVVTYCFVGLLSNMSMEEFENSNTLKNCIEGIQERLHSTLSHVRKTCSVSYIVYF